MRRLYTAGIFGMIVMVAASLAMAAGPNMEPGKWEITTKIEMPGIPVQMPPITTTQCLTRDNLVPAQTSPGGNQPCEVKNVVTEGDTVKWDMECGGGEKMSGHGEITYHGDSFEGLIRIVTKTPGEGKNEMTLHLKGKRLGACE